MTSILSHRGLHPIEKARRSRLTVAGQSECTCASGVVMMLALLATVLAGCTALVGVFWQGGDAPATFTSVRGEVVELQQTGIYSRDSAAQAIAKIGVDATTLVIAIPLLVSTLVGYRRGSVRTSLLLLGALVWFLYVGVSLSLGTSYNPMFPVYVALLAVSFVAVMLHLNTIAPAILEAHSSPAIPTRFPGGFMLLSGALMVAIWMLPLVAALLTDDAPQLLDASTTMASDALALGIAVPVAILSGVLILRRSALGYLVACPLLMFEALLVPSVVLQTLFRLNGDGSISPGEALPVIATLASMGVGATACLLMLLDHIVDDRESVGRSAVQAHTDLGP